MSLPAPVRRWLSPVIGLAALVWFLVRVVPRPSRASYPCQRAAFPIAAAFVSWLASWALWRRGWALAARRRYLTTGLCWIVAIPLALWALVPPAGDSAAAIDVGAPNAPIGVARGIHPGRVVWNYDPAAAVWNNTGDWYSDTATRPAVARRMLDESLLSLTGTTTVADAWNALFTHYNQTHGRGTVGYRAGEKIVIKINLNPIRSYGASDRTTPSPQVIRALLEGLIQQAGVAENAITLYDAPRYVPDWIFNYCRASFPGVIFVDNNGQSGRVLVQRDTSATVRFADARLASVDLPTCATQATYSINLSILKGHQMAGVTLSGKNLFGSVYTGTATERGWRPETLHDSVTATNPMGAPNVLVDLLGHRQLGGKTVLYLMDGLYSAFNSSGPPTKWQSAPFNGRWPSSLLLSQDPMAIDSVAFDFLRNEPAGNTVVTGSAENYLHEGALADAPPSGVFYDPEGDGTRLASLGVHEHWNGAAEKKYTRNLGTGNGIELLALMAGTTPTPTATPPGAFVEITPGASGVSASTSDGNVPANTVDNNLSTRWSGAGDGAWIRYDLGSPRTVAFAKIAVYNGNGRRNIFDLQLSADGVAWTTVWSGQSSGTTTMEEACEIADTEARYLRYLGHGSTVGTFNSVTEVSIFAPSSIVTPTPTPTGPPPTPTPRPTATPTLPVTITPTPTATPPLSIVEVTPPGSAVASSTSDANLAANTVDDNLSTRWSANGDGAWVRYDLGSVRTVALVKVAVYNGNSRRNIFDLQVSADGAAWTTVWSGQSSGTTTQEETYEIADADARFVRYLGHGATTSTFNSVTEVSVFALAGPAATPTPSPTSTAPPELTPTPTATPKPDATPTPTPTPTARPAMVEVTPPGSAVTASTSDSNLPANVVDNGLATRWSGNGDGAWLQLDLGTSRRITHLRLAVYGGNARRNRFDLQVSSGGGAWTTVLSGIQNSGTTTVEETYDFADVDARWVRYVGHGATLNGGTASPWNSLTEVSVFAESSP